MKSFFVVIALSALIALAKGDDVKEKFKKTAEKCKEKHAVTEEEIEKLKAKDTEFQYSHVAKCYMACFLEEGKILQNGKYNKENALVMTDVIHKENPEQAAKGKEIIETCAKQYPEVGEDQCEFAYQVSVCAAKEAKKVGLENTDFFAK
uniref:Odorant-binding protein 14 n=1 Tax=Halyomorpha halys TaxID=286706 RepID=A0A1L2JGQ3_HALHY|nr:odorant-binding protein 14 [Halyomorpha halys]